MARLHEDSDDDLPELSTVMADYACHDLPRSREASKVTPIAATQGQGQRDQSYQNKSAAGTRLQLLKGKVDNDFGDERKRIRRQVPLTVGLKNTILLNPPRTVSRDSRTILGSYATSGDQIGAIDLPKESRERTVKRGVDDGARALGRRRRLRPLDGDTDTPVSQSACNKIVDGESWIPTQSSSRRARSRAADSELATPGSTSTGSNALSLESVTNVVIGAVLGRSNSQQDDTRSNFKPRDSCGTVPPTEEGMFSNEPSAMLRLYRTSTRRSNIHADAMSSSPPRSRRRSPAKCAEGVRFTTPPATPSSCKLQSPKKHERIPPSPYRPSIDAFWSQDVVNEWNDEYSPKKVPNFGGPGPIVSVIDLDEEDELSPSTSPRKSPVKAPAKRDRKVIEAKKAFNEKKHGLARDFLKELDDVIAGGQVSSLAASTGGIHLNWSKKLNSTAGRANWRQEVVKPDRNGDAPTSKYHHHASIELAEKVIDNEDRLVNVIAHEYCHLANFMISGIKNHPHGKEFRQWAKKCSQAFHHRGIEVTTKHSYIIAYKYIWECTKCGHEYKRHSKSIDPGRHTCGSCKSTLMQTQPVPRTAAPSEYQLYIKTNFQQIKNAHPESSQKEVMGLLAKAYKEQKIRIDLTNKLPVIAGTMVSHEQKGCVEEKVCKIAELDSVSRTLDFLTLA